MKQAVSIALALPFLALSSCASGPDPDQPVASACADMECFRESSIRDIELLDDKTLVAFVGPNRCAYRMELDGDYCEYTIMGPTIDFVPAGRGARMQEESSGSQRICLSDRPYIADPMTGPMSAAGGDTLPGSMRDRRVAGLPAPETRRYTGNTDRGNQCRVAKITPLSDDELLELYSDKGAQSPLPPVGSGQVSVPGNEKQTAQSEGEAETAPSGTGQGGSAEPSSSGDGGGAP